MSLRPLRHATALLALACALGAPRPAQAGTEQLEMSLGGIVQVRPKLTIAGLSVGDPNVVDVSPLGSSAVLIKGLAIGSTTLMIWGRNDRTKTYRIRIGVDAEELGGTLEELFPGQLLTVETSGETLIIGGTLKSAEDVHALVGWLGGYQESLGPSALRLQVINRVRLTEPQQVRLEVRFAEVSRTKLRKLGLTLIGHLDGHTGGLFGAVAGAPPLQASPGGGVDLPATLPGLGQSAGILFMANPTARMPFNALLSVLGSRGIAKTLTEPTVVAQSGKEAEFLVGGEFPVPIPQGIAQVSIEYKPFGVEVQCKPVVLSDETIQLDVSAKVSDLAGSVALQGIQVPSLTSRRSKTTVRLRSGQSFALAGLMSEKMRNTVHKVPLLGDIPIIGMLFRSSTSEREETELVMVVTAHLVGPVGEEAMPPLPGEGILSDPTDLEFFLLGWTEDDDPDPGLAAAKPTGSVGYRD